MSLAKIRPRRGTKTEWEMVDPVLLEGELGIESPDSGIGSGLCKFKLGDGYKKWTELPYAFDATSAQSIYGGNVNVHNDIYIRSDTKTNWENENPIIGLGEIVYDITTKAIKIGNGSDPFSALAYIGIDYETLLEWDFGDIDVDPTPIGPTDVNTDFGDLDSEYNVNN
jgi:hypothetical protein